MSSIKPGYKKITFQVTIAQHAKFIRKAKKEFGSMQEVLEDKVKVYNRTK